MVGCSIRCLGCLFERIRRKRADTVLATNMPLSELIFSLFTDPKHAHLPKVRRTRSTSYRSHMRSRATRTRQRAGRILAIPPPICPGLKIARNSSKRFTAALLHRKVLWLSRLSSKEGRSPCVSCPSGPTRQGCILLNQTANMRLDH
jgi:hypothetical protein